MQVVENIHQTEIDSNGNTQWPKAEEIFQI